MYPVKKWSIDDRIIGFDWASGRDYTVTVQRWPEQTCERCLRASTHRLDFWVPDLVWQAVDRGQYGVLCLECFDRTARERYEAGLIDQILVRAYVEHLTLYGLGCWLLQPWAQLRIARIRGTNGDITKTVVQVLGALELDIEARRTAQQGVSELLRVRNGLQSIQQMVAE